MIESDYEFAYIIVQYRSGIHRVQRVRSPYNCKIVKSTNKFDDRIFAISKHHFVSEAYLTYEQAWSIMVKLHDEYKQKVYWKMKAVMNEYKNLSNRDKEIILEGKNLGYFGDVG